MRTELDQVTDARPDVGLPAGDARDAAREQLRDGGGQRVGHGRARISSTRVGSTAAPTAASVGPGAGGRDVGGGGARRRRDRAAVSPTRSPQRGHRPLRGGGSGGDLGSERRRSGRQSSVGHCPDQPGAATRFPGITSPGLPPPGADSGTVDATGVLLDPRSPRSTARESAMHRRSEPGTPRNRCGQCRDWSVAQRRGSDHALGRARRRHHASRCAARLSTGDSGRSGYWRGRPHRP